LHETCRIRLDMRDPGDDASGAMVKPVAIVAGFVLAGAAFGAFASTPATVRTALVSEPLLRLPARPADAIGGLEFARRTSGLSVADRDRAVVAELERGNIPSFLRHLTPVKLAAHTPGPTVGATIWVTPDYLAIGSDDDFLYVPLTYYSATIIADRFGSVLPTAKMVDAIYEQSAHHLTPAPLPAGPLMCSNLYLEKHQQRIDEQRSGLPLGELISGHKKDLVLTNRLRELPGRVAIYGWHRAPGAPIQPLSTVHGAQYVDYSHGVRLVSTTVDVDGRPCSIYDALQDSHVAPVLSREGVTRDPWGLMHPRVSAPGPASAGSFPVARTR
jgi:hypothetical protein